MTRDDRIRVSVDDPVSEAPAVVELAAAEVRAFEAGTRVRSRAECRAAHASVHGPIW